VRRPARADPKRKDQLRSSRLGAWHCSRGSITKSQPVMLSMTPGMRPAHERYAAAARRVQQRITRALEIGDYDKVRALSADLQALAKKAAASKPSSAAPAGARRSRS
jgi:hypothetical protein